MSHVYALGNEWKNVSKRLMTIRLVLEKEDSVSTADFPCSSFLQATLTSESSLLLLLALDLWEEFSKDHRKSWGLQHELWLSNLFKTSPSASARHPLNDGTHSERLTCRQFSSEENITDRKYTNTQATWCVHVRTYVRVEHRLFFSWSCWMNTLR